MSKRPRWTRWFVALVVLASVPVTAGAAAAEVSGVPQPPVPQLTWAPCGPDFPATECAVATVPLDYDEPTGSTTEVALVRIPATDQENPIGSVFVNPGGPGGSGVEFVLSGFGEFLNANLDGRFDVVGFDPRGVGARTRCTASRAKRS
jgi:pimeloyl-ACP methyl ester carboxylesterase